MPEKTKNRKLAAILFADIEGYTAQMQKDEVGARQNLEKFRNTLNQQVPRFDGQVIQYYGDGCLCTFESAVDAMTCAEQVQRVFQAEPSVPVRIGLHSGDVFFEAGNVYGDSVNIASRVESLGVAGAVLFSKRIKRHLANQPRFLVKSLGVFHFKNVEKSMEIFALANPGLTIPATIGSREKTKASSGASPRKFGMPAALVLVGLLIVAFFFFSKSQNSTLFEGIKDDRVAVLVFQNKTGDPELDYVGHMASEWVTRALIETNKAKVVNPNSVRQNMQLASLDPEVGQVDKETFAKVTGAKYLIWGSYYKEGEDLIFSSQIDDATTGMVQFSFNEYRGALEKPSNVIRDMKNKIAGYWLSQGQVLQSKFSPPDKDAWLEYQKGRDAWAGNSKKSFIENVTQSLQHFQKAIELDSTFMLPWIQIGMCYANLNRSCNNPALVEHFKILESKKDLMSEYEWNVFQIDKHRFPKDFASAAEFARRNYELDPLSLRDNFLLGNTLMNSRQPVQSIIEIHEKIPYELVPDNTDRKNLVMNLAWAYYYNDQFDDALDILKYSTYPWHEQEVKCLIAIRRNDKNTLEKILESPSPGLSLYNLGWEAECEGKPELANIIYQQGIDLAKSDLEVGICHWHLGNDQPALAKLKNINLESEQYSFKGLALLYYFLAYERSGATEKAAESLRKLEVAAQRHCLFLTTYEDEYWLAAAKVFSNSAEVPAKFLEEAQQRYERPFHPRHPIVCRK